MDEEFRGDNLRADYARDMFVVPEKIGAALNDRDGLNHFFFYVGVRLVFTGAVVPINCRRETISVCAGIDQMTDRSVPLRLPVRNSGFKIGDGEEHIPRLRASHWVGSDKP